MPSKIEWTDEVWNCLTGCTPVSEGCTNCYAALLAATRLKDTPRYKGIAVVNSRGQGVFNGRMLMHEDLLTKPLKWRKPRRVFVNSMSDLFHPDVPFEFIDKVFAVMALCGKHTFQVLTKRPERMAEYMRYVQGEGNSSKSNAGYDYRTWWAGKAGFLCSRYYERQVVAFDNAVFPLPNVWLGTSVEDQATADERIPHLLKCPAAVRFLSCEPLLGPITFADVPGFNLAGSAGRELLDNLWVICGGESGPNARPMHPDWARSLRDQCAAAGVPFFFKQWGEWAPNRPEGFYTHNAKAFGSKVKNNLYCYGNDGLPYTPLVNDKPEGYNIGQAMYRLGKKRAGRLLDGALHDEYPSNP